MTGSQESTAAPLVMVDACVTQHALEFESGHEDRSVTWGERTFIVRLARRVRKRLPEGQWLQREIPLLPAVAVAADEGKIVLCRGGELAWEASHPRPAFFEGPASPFQGLSFQGLNPPFHYGRVMLSYNDRAGEAHARQKVFFESIQYPRFLKILHGIGGNKHADAFHLWTAEHNHVDYFLTTDRKLINSVRGSRVSINVQVVAPSKLLEELGLSY